MWCPCAQPWVPQPLQVAGAVISQPTLQFIAYLLPYLHGAFELHVEYFSSFRWLTKVFLLWRLAILLVTKNVFVCLFVFISFFFPLDFFHSISLKITFWSSLRLMQIENELQGIVQNMQRQERVRTSHCSDMRSFRSKHKKIHVIFTLLSWRRWRACT